MSIFGEKKFKKFVNKDHPNIYVTRKDSIFLRITNISRIADKIPTIFCDFQSFSMSQYIMRRILLKNLVNVIEPATKN